MASESLPADVKKLVSEHITSVEQLEILLLLRKHPGDEFTAREVSEEIRTSERSAAARLDALVKSTLVEVRPHDDGARYRFAPASDWLVRACAQLEVAYSDHRYAVIDFIFTKPIDRLRLYADAFRFRRDAPDG